MTIPLTIFNKYLIIFVNHFNKNYMKRSFSTIALLLLITFGLNAQILEPVNWSFSSNKITDKEYELVFKADIDIHWHLYSQDIPMSPPATRFTFNQNSDYTLVGNVTEESAVIEEYDPNFEMTLKYFAHEAIFKQKVKLTGEGSKVTGVLEFMSCDDTKCLPPTEVDFNFTLGTPSQGGAQKSQILEPVKWNITSKKLSSNTIELTFDATIDKGYHLYSLTIPEDGPLPTVFTFEESKSIILDGDVQEAIIPIEEFDEVFEMDIKFFEDKASFKQTIKLNSDESNIPLVGEIAYMVCNEIGCVALYEDFSLTISDGVIVNSDLPNPIEISSTSNTNDGINNTWGAVIDQVKEYGNSGNKKETKTWWFIFIAGFIGGLIALVTPCVWPIIPMTVTFFLKRSDNNRGKGIRDAVIYGISIIIIYVALGLGITLIFGADALNALSTSAFFNILFFLLLVVFAAAFFGAFELTLPSKWTNAMDQKADKTSGLLSIFFMAFTLALVSFSCTGPIIGTLLVEAAVSGAKIGPFIGMLGFSLALAIPFTIFAIFPSWLQSMPKSGGWLNSVKVVLGFLELALALKFLSIADLAYHWGILDREVFLVLWIVLFTLLGFYLLGKIKFAHDSDVPFVSVTRMFLATISLAFAIYMIPGLWGAPLKAISAFSPPLSTQDFSLYDDEVHAKFEDYDLGMSYAKRVGKPVLVDFTGWGCVNCRKMENSVWIDSRVREYLMDDYVLISLYVDDKTPLPMSEIMEVTENGETKRLTTVGKKWSYLQRFKFGNNSQPFYVTLDHEGNLLNAPRNFDTNIDAYIKFLQSGIKEFKKNK